MTPPEFINGLSALESRHHGCVATIGSFDGVHRGHRVLLEQLRQRATELALPSLVMIFEPQPYEFFSREQAPARLTRLREKVLALFDAGVDRVLCVKFDRLFRSLTAAEFVDQVLIRQLGIAHLVVGDDFRFGCDRTGDFPFLQKRGAESGFSVCDTKTQLEANARISSTRIRQLLQEDRIAEAAALLGREYSVTGRVTHGQQLGRKLGFPTANLALGRCRAPVQGVYAVTAAVREAGESRVWMNGVANVGLRPTVSGGRKPLLEVHLLDRAIDLYGCCLEVRFQHKLRAESRFESLEALQQQIARDIASARQWFGEREANNQS